MVRTTRLPSRPGEFHPEPLTDPDVTLSRHPARATERRLPPPVENWAPPVASWLTPNVGDLPPSLHGHYPASSLLRSSPPLSAASVLSASQFRCLYLFPGIAGLLNARGVQLQVSRRHGFVDLSKVAPHRYRVIGIAIVDQFFVVILEPDQLDRIVNHSRDFDRLYQLRGGTKPRLPTEIARRLTVVFV